MSTYNSKFSGAEIDALLEKVASGQVGGGGSSEMEELAKEVGATHKHTITLTFPPAYANAKARGVTYTNSADLLTVDRITKLLRAAQGAYIYGTFAMSANGIVATSSSTWGLLDSGPFAVQIGLEFSPSYTIIDGVDFTNSTYSTSSVNILSPEPVPVSQLIEHGGTFTDDVTEL